MILALSTAALAQECQTRLDTWQSFHPVASSMTWEVPGGWDKRRLAEFPSHRVALAELEKNAFKRYPVAIQDALLGGRLPDADALDEVALKLAWGEPDYAWDSREQRGCRDLLYSEPAEVVETCDGEIVARHPLTAPIPCDRLDAVAPRLGRWDLADLTRAEAVAVLAGVVDRWMDEPILELAFGKPLEKRRRQRVYFDDAGIVAGLTVDLDEAGYALAWKYDGAEPTIALVQPVQPDDAGGDTADSVRTAGAADEGPRATGGASGSVVLPLADVPDGEHRLAGRCADRDLYAEIDFEEGRFTASLRVVGSDPGRLRVYRTQGPLRGSVERLFVEGVGTAVLSGSLLEVTLGGWPTTECAGVLLAP